jgi:hypothetical protein
LATGRLRIAALVVAVGLTHSVEALQPAASADTAKFSALRQHQRCFDRDYAREKKSVVAAQGANATRSADTDDIDSDDIDSKDGRILQEAAPLPEPPEIARVQRGLASRFVGLFINDGLEGWSAIDLDRSMLISVQRRIYDVRAKRSHPFADPKFPAERHLGHSFARKFSSKDRIELEVVSTVEIDPQAMQAFICVANASWAAAATELPAISDGSQDTVLLDVESNGGKTTYFSKSVSFGGPLGFVFGAMAKYLPAPSW